MLRKSRCCFPAALRFAELTALVEELGADHAKLREDFAGAEAHKMSPERLLDFARRLSAHIRREERQLFERMQELMNAVQLADLGARLEEALKGALQACALPMKPVNCGRRNRATQNKTPQTQF